MITCSWKRSTVIHILYGQCHMELLTQNLANQSVFLCLNYNMSYYIHRYYHDSPSWLD